MLFENHSQKNIYKNLYWCHNVPIKHLKTALVISLLKVSFNFTYSLEEEMNNFFGKTIIIAVFLLVISINTNAETFTANLSSSQEVPTNASTATGYARVFLNETTGMINFTVVFSGLSSNQSGAHIHGPAARGVNASVIINLGTPGGTSGTITGTAAITPTQITQLRAHQTYLNVHSSNFPNGEIRGQLAPKRPLDYDGDGKTDYSILRFPAGNPAQITYWNRNSQGFASNQTVPFGEANTDFPAPGDYDGDGKDDLALYRAGASAGQQSFFIIYRSSDITVQWIPWGIFGDQAVARDYDGDGITDVAVFRPGASATVQTTWWIKRSSDGGVQIIPFGLTGNGTSQFDTPIPGDYDGDGKFDVAVYRFGLTPMNNYIVMQSSDNAVTYTQWGNFNTDFITPGDYDGDGKWEVAAVRTGATGVPFQWWIRQSSNGQMRVVQWGLSATTFAQFDQPTQGDYDGDGITDISVWRPSAIGNDSAFYTLSSLNGSLISNQWGRNGDFAVNNFDSR
jgi:hypothetical protein